MQISYNPTIKFSLAHGMACWARAQMALLLNHIHQTFVVVYNRKYIIIFIIVVFQLGLFSTNIDCIKL
jgi:hypothetical protein